MTITHEIGNYQLVYYAKRQNESFPITEINFRNSQNQFIGRISFYKEGQPVPDNAEETAYTTSRIYLHASENQLDRVVDMLRNEKPCRVYYSNPTSAFVYTGKEPVGEEETE